MDVQLSRGLDCGPTNRMITIIRMDPSIVVHNLFDFLSFFLLRVLLFCLNLKLFGFFPKKLSGNVLSIRFSLSCRAIPISQFT